ncbi:MAG: hypothetical protein Aureis2KO_00740 [Aureisphaera sp.]
MAQDDKASTPQIGIKMDIDETVTLGEVSITFVKVLEDSRCPKYVNCMWAGQARIEVMISEKGKDTITKEITLGANEASSKNKTFFKKDNYFIKVMALNPYPEDGKEKEPYTLLICEGS